MKRAAHVSHRGGSLVAPENTMAAFQLAIARYATDQLEMDVRLTRDGMVVVLHDETVDRTTDGQAPIAQLSWAEVQRLDAGYRFTPDGGRTFPFRGTGVKIPSLAEVLAATGLPVMIELKESGADCRRAVAEIIRAAGAVDRVCVGVWKGDVANRLADEMSELALFFPEPTARAFVSAALLEQRPPPSPFDVLALPEREGSLDLSSPRIVAAARNAGVRLQLWTIDDPTRMRQCLDRQVDGILTDRPDLLRQVMQQGSCAR
jgi:glycerophosphoryl diester phosphodiesterase